MPKRPDPPPDVLTQPPPRLSRRALLGHLARHWGLAGTLSPLTSERDLNHRLDSPAGPFTVKLANAAEPLAMTEFQTGALRHLERTGSGLPLPRLIPLTDGRPWLDLPQGRLRVLTWLKGAPMAGTPRSPAQAASVGAALAGLARALAGYDHPAARHVLLWDIAQLPALAGLLPEVADAALRDRAAGFIADFGARIAPRLDALPRQVCHADFNPHNLLVDAAAPDRLTGIIDFGDMVATPRICDLAVAAAYQTDPAAPLPALAAMVGAYAAVNSLTAAELALLPDLIRARMMTTLVIGAWRAARYPDNAAYILRNAPAARDGLAALAALPEGRLAEALTAAANGAAP